MATTEAEDPLANLRQAITAEVLPIPTTTADATKATDAEPNLAKATHLQFNHNDQHRSFPLSTPTRFLSNGNPVDLRSVFLAYQNKNTAIPDYLAATQRLNEELSAPGGLGGRVQNLVFIEKLDLIQWLEGQSDESENIKPLAGAAAVAAAQAGGAADIASGIVGGIATVPSAGAAARGPKQADPRLVEIYNGERRLGDSNSILRGIKPTDFSHVRKHAEAFLSRTRPRPSGPTVPASSSSAPNPALVSNLKKPVTRPGRRIEPIILLSPSASSLLRMSNIKSFLVDGLYVPPDSSSASANLLHITRLLPSIDPNRPLRFIIVDGTEQFKPDYWDRVVAVFTTGQTWQFKSYKWTQPAELFSHALGIYVGWRGEDLPGVVKGWGRGVVAAQIDKWSGAQGTSMRWRDREVVEGLWGAIEEGMRARGWGKDGPR